MKTSELLQKAKALIANPDNWVRNMEAADKDGNPAYVYGRHAVRFCASGACYKISGQASNYRGSEAHMALSETVRRSRANTRGWTSIIDFNDRQDGGAERVHAQLMRLFDKTIKRLEAQGR